MFPTRAFVAILVTIIPCTRVRAFDDGEARRPHVLVSYRGLDAEYGEAIARLVEAAYAVYRDDFGFDMPEQVKVSAACDRGNRLRLWTDGQDHVMLTLKSSRQLRRPSKSGVFNVYGFCHELGHMAMYRTLKKRSWLSGDAAEGWAHYCGSYVVDRVYKAEGEDLWPDGYDYRADGMKRLEAQLDAKKPSGVAVAAGRWRGLVKLIGRKRMPDVFEAWDDADPNPAAPQKALRNVVLKIGKKSKSSKLKHWFKAFAEDCVVEIERSDQAYRTIKKKRLSGDALLVKYDDGGSDGKQSIAGSGHAVFFVAPPGEWYVTRVQIYGSRYGHPRAPDEDVTITLCDEGLKPIRAWTRPYSLFERGEPRWHRILLGPTSVPARFAICFDFSPTATKGVFVHRDDSSEGHSAVALPGRRFEILEGYDWMIRVELDAPKTANPLKG